MPCSDWLGPAATIFAWCVAVGVTAYFAKQQTAIANEQARTAKEKLRQDLFEKRWAIFESTFDYYRAMIGWEGSPEQERANVFFAPINNLRSYSRKR